MGTERPWHCHLSLLSIQLSNELSVTGWAQLYSYSAVKDSGANGSKNTDQPEGGGMMNGLSESQAAGSQAGQQEVPNLLVPTIT